jgi:hypothetical protein
VTVLRLECSVDESIMEFENGIRIGVLGHIISVGLMHDKSSCSHIENPKSLLKIFQVHHEEDLVRILFKFYTDLLCVGMVIDLIMRHGKRSREVSRHLIRQKEVALSVS